MKNNRGVCGWGGGGGRALSARLGVEGTTMSLRADGSRRGNPVEDATSLTGSPRASALAMTPTESVLCLVNRLSVKKCAFTMAEILLSLTIIGVVAAITLPSLTGNINERTWNTQRKALYARFSQAIALMPALNGYGTLRETTDSAGSTSIEDTAAETFVTNGLAKVLKINNICDNEHLEDCGLPKKIMPFIGEGSTASALMLEDITTLVDFNERFDFDSGGWSYHQLNTKAAAFETANGESVLVYYNPLCKSIYNESEFRSQAIVCANFVYDLNGSRGPNTVGKDIGFITALQPTDTSVVAPVPTDKVLDVTVVYEGNVRFCREQSEEVRLPNRDELISLFVNRSLINFTLTDAFSSSMVIGDPTRSWRCALHTGNCAQALKTHPGRSMCVKR